MGYYLNTGRCDLNVNYMIFNNKHDVLFGY